MLGWSKVRAATFRSAGLIGCFLKSSLSCRSSTNYICTLEAGSGILIDYHHFQFGHRQQGQGKSRVPCLPGGRHECGGITWITTIWAFFFLIFLFFDFFPLDFASRERKLFLKMEEMDTSFSSLSL